MDVLLMILTAIVVVAFFGVVAYNVHRIALLLEAIGGKPTSYLAKLRLGLRAIETETAHLPVQVTELNQGLTAIAEGLQVVDNHLVGTIDAVVKQRGGLSMTAVEVIWLIVLIVAVVIVAPLVWYLLHRTWKAAHNIERYFAEMLTAGLAWRKTRRTSRRSKTQFKLPRQS